MIEITILGQPPSKSNCYGVRRIGNRAGMYKKKPIKDYEKSFLEQVPLKYRGINIEYEMSVELHCYYDSRRPDIDNSAKVILDCLQSAGVIKNDNKVYRLLMTKNVDKNIGSKVEIKISKCNLGS